MKVSRKIYFFLKRKFKRRMGVTTPHDILEIMGESPINYENLINTVPYSPTNQCLIYQVHFSHNLLEKCKDTHMAVAVQPQSIIQIHNEIGDKIFAKDQVDSWYVSEMFAKKHARLSWYLVPKEPILDDVKSIKNEVIPSARAMVHIIISHHQDTGNHLYEGIYLRSGCLDSNNRRIYVGNFGEDGIRIVPEGDSRLVAGRVGLILAKQPDLKLDSH